MIPKKALEEFKQIYKGEDISDELAMEEAVTLLTFFNVVYRPIKKEWLQEYLRTHPDDQG